MKWHLLLLLTSISFSFTSEKIPERQLVDIATLSTEFEYEIRYATDQNFIKEVLYDCAKCMLRPEVATALLKANYYFCQKGYKIKIYDCYRPLDVQKKMWEKVPRATYVGNPYEGGSVHNRGAAVDITLVTLEGCYVEMGSDYDYFGREAHIDNYNFPEEVLLHRKLLFKGMRAVGFNTIRTEWWHFSFENNWKFEVLNEPLPCNE